MTKIRRTHYLSLGPNALLISPNIETSESPIVGRSFVRFGWSFLALLAVLAEWSYSSSEWRECLECRDRRLSCEWREC